MDADDRRKILLGAVAAVAVVAALIVVYRSVGPGGSDTQSGAQEQARELAITQDKSSAIPKDQYDPALSGAVSNRAKGGR